jgi:hypothetical protein
LSLSPPTRAPESDLHGPHSSASIRESFFEKETGENKREACNGEGQNQIHKEKIKRQKEECPRLGTARNIV